MGLKSGIFKSTLLDYSTWKHVGEVQTVSVSSISSVLSRGSVPIVTCMGETLDGSEYLNINADVAAVQMSRHLSDVGKLIFVSAAGGLKDEDGMIIDSIDLSSEYDRYMGMDWVKYGTRLKLKQFHRLLQDTTVLNEIFVTNPGGIVQSVMSTMEDTSDSDEDYVLKWKDSPGTVVYRSGSPLKERKEGPRFKVGLLGTCCVLYPLFFETSTLSNTRCPRIRRTRTLETSRYAS